MLTGYFAKKMESLAWGVVFGLAVGMLPGSILGAVFATQRYGGRAPGIADPSGAVR